MIRLNGVSKSFDGKIVLDKVNLQIPKGSVFGLVGPNGSGKSTILRLLCGVYQLDEGFIMIEDQPVYENVALKRRIFFVADEPYFFRHSTLLEMKQFYQLFYPNFSKELYQRLLKVFPINEKTKISIMSKGMKRQVLLILALATRPDYLFLDEAFDGLDPVMRLTLKRMIAEEITSRQMTVIISSHNLRELEDICDTLGLLSNNTIQIAGTTEDIKAGIQKVQLCFTDPISKDELQPLQILHYEQRGSVISMVARNTEDEIRTVVGRYKPILFELLPVTLEEVFVYEMEAQGYGQYVE